MTTVISYFLPAILLFWLTTFNPKNVEFSFSKFQKVVKKSHKLPRT